MSANFTTAALPSELEQLALPNESHAATPFTYEEVGTHSHEELTKLADREDYDRKTTRLRRRPSQVFVQATPDSYQLVADESKLMKLFENSLGETIPQLSRLIIHCRAREQQAHMYREIAVKFSKENQDLRQMIEQDRGTFQDSLNQTEEEGERRLALLQEEISQLKLFASPASALSRPTLGSSSARRAPVLPFTPSTRRTATQGQSSEGHAARYAGHTPSSFVAATPLMTSTRVTRQGSSKATIKFPDPPMLKDGKEVKFEQWRDQLEDKLRANADHYTGATLQDTQQSMVAYMRTRTEGKAYESLSTLIRTLRASQEPFDHTYLLDRMEKNYGNPHKRVEARAAFRRLRLLDPADFADFQSDFFQLAQEQGLPADQWVEEFHDKLMPTLRAMMAPYMRSNRHDFDTYVDLARDISREHAATHRVEGRRSGKHQSNTPPAPAPANDSRSTTPTAAAPPASASRHEKKKKPALDEVTCYNCQKLGHYSRDCPAPRAENKLVEENPSDDDDSEDSENGSA